MEERQLEDDVQQSADEDDLKRSEIHFVGGRSAVLFRAASGEPLPPLELPDDFFELSKEEVALLYKGFKQTRDDLENMPFRSRAVREMEESASQLSRLAQYTHTVIRVQFPDRLVLQAVFNHSDTVQTVISFLSDFLESSVQGYLYTAPPKTVLRAEQTLVEAGLTPRALVYFGLSSPGECTTFLKTALSQSLTCPRLASEAALHYRRVNVSEGVNQDNSGRENTSAVTGPSNTAANCNKRTKQTTTKVPKWFRKP